MRMFFRYRCRQCGAEMESQELKTPDVEMARLDMLARAWSHSEEGYKANVYSAHDCGSNLMGVLELIGCRVVPEGDVQL